MCVEHDGSGGSSYIDSVVARERDNTAWGVNANTTGWAIASRQYLLQNWRADVVRATDSSGNITDRIRYTAYGEPQRFSLFDVGTSGGNTPDGSFDNYDYTAFINSFGIGDASVDPAADVDHDGTIDGSDYIAFMNALANGDEGPLGTGQLSLELDAGFRRGYAGYEFDPVLGASSASIYHVRNRVYDAENGRWNRRDPLGYVDGMGLYEYCRSMPSVSTDPSGLAAAVPCDRNVLSACMTLALLHGIANLSPCAGAVRFMQTAPQCACALPLILGVEGAVIARCLLALTATAVVVVTSPLVVRSYDPFARYGDEGTFRLPRIDFIAPHIEIMIREWEWAPGYPRRPSKGEKCRLSSTGGDPSGSGPRTCNYWCSRSGQTITIRIPKGDQWVTPACPQELQF